MKKTLSKKILAGTIAASFVLGAGFVGALHNQAYAASTDRSTIQKSDAAGKDRGGFKGHGARQGGNVAKQAAAVLGVEESSIQASLKEGKTLVEIATAAGLTEDDFLANLVTAETTTINEQVTAGKLTQAQADKLIADLPTRMKEQIERAGSGDNGDGREGGPDGDGGRGFHESNIMEETATLLGVEQSTIQASLKEGKTLLEIAQAAGLTEDDYLAKLVAVETASINAQVTAGTLTQEQADQNITELSDQLKQRISNAGFQDGPNGGGQGHQGQGGGFFGNNEMLTQILGLTADELQTELDAGKSIAEIAAAKEISEDDLISQIKDNLTDSLKKFVEDTHQKPEASADASTDTASN